MRIAVVLLMYRSVLDSFIAM